MEGRVLAEYERCGWGTHTGTVIYRADTGVYAVAARKRTHCFILIGL